MTLTGSTVAGHAGGNGELLCAAAGILGGGRMPHAEAVTLLLPMVRRAVRTARGPSALVAWLRHRPAPAAGPPARPVELAEDLARLLADSAGPAGETVAGP